MVYFISQHSDFYVSGNSKDSNVADRNRQMEWRENPGELLL
jgi:hypothetical protein